MDEQILDAFVVDLKHRHTKLIPNVICVLTLLLVYPFEKLHTNHRHDPNVLAIADNRVALARPCLAVRKQTSVVAIKSIDEDIVSLESVDLTKSSMTCS